MPIFYNGEQVKRVQVVSEGKKKLVATTRMYRKNEGHFRAIESDRVEVKEYEVGKDGKKRLKSIGTFSFDDMIVDYFL